MKKIEIDDDLYTYIASQTQHIGESASDILRRLIYPQSLTSSADTEAENETVSETINQSIVTSDIETEPQAAAAQTTATPTTDTQNSDTDVLTQLDSEVMSNLTKQVDRFIFILSVLYQQHADSFAAVTTIVGKNRLYFADSKEALLEHGSNTNPKQITDSPYWVVTNNNTDRKKMMLGKVCELLGYDETQSQAILTKFTLS